MYIIREKTDFIKLSLISTPARFVTLHLGLAFVIQNHIMKGFDDYSRAI